HREGVAGLPSLATRSHNTSRDSTPTITVRDLAVVERARSDFLIRLRILSCISSSQVLPYHPLFTRPLLPGRPASRRTGAAQSADSRLRGGSITPSCFRR